MCEGGVEVARGGDGARLLVELGPIFMMRIMMLVMSARYAAKIVMIIIILS